MGFSSFTFIPFSTSRIYCTRVVVFLYVHIFHFLSISILEKTLPPSHHSESHRMLGSRIFLPFPNPPPPISGCRYSNEISFFILPWMLPKKLFPFSWKILIFLFCFDSISALLRVFYLCILSASSHPKPRTNNGVEKKLGLCFQLFWNSVNIPQPP